MHSFGAEPWLAREVAELVEAYAAAGEFLDRPAVEAAATLAEWFETVRPRRGGVPAPSRQ